MPKTRIWSRTKNGLRCHLGSGIWHINARVNGRVITPTTTRTAERYDAEVIKNQRIAAAKLPNAAEQAAIIKAGFTFQPFIEEYLRVAEAKPDGPTRDRKIDEVTYLRRRWAAFRNIPWAEVEVARGQPRPLSPPSPLDLEDPRKLTVVDLLNFQKELLKTYVPIAANRLARIVTNVLLLAEDTIPSWRSPHRKAAYKPIPVGGQETISLPSENTIRAVLAHIRAQDRPAATHDADLAEALAYTGLRINEANRLRVGQVNLNVPCLTLSKDIVKGKRRGRTVPLVPAAVVLFTRLVANALPDGRVFRSKQINRGIRLACEAVKCERLTHHSFRHWFATLALEKTGDAKQVADWLGHSDGGKLVWALYSHLRSDRTAELAKKLDFDWGATKVVTE